MTLEPGVRVGPYDILAALGAGGMGEVYQARDERLGRDIALKILSTNLAASGEHLRRFEQEARAASALNHPNIITIYDIGRVDSMAYIAMELIEGRDVRSMIAGEPLPMKQALRIAVKVADGLAAAHERGIVHRDLKPENLMVSRDGFVKILDFGLAKLVRPFTDDDTTLPHTTPGAVFGTVGYMSPEQAAARTVDFRSDQFALGVILYEMLTGRVPFSERTAAETLAAIIRNDPPPLTIYNDKIPAELVRIVTRLLAKEPDERYASTRDLARDLREVRDRISNSSDAATHVSGVRTTPPNRTRIPLAAAIVVIAGIAGVMVVRRQPPALPAVTAQVSTLAVLPFAAKGGSPDAQVFADGVAEVVSMRLAQTGLKIIDMFTAEAGSARGDLLRIARERGASRAIQGEVGRIGNELSVTYSVVDTSTGESVGGQTIRGTGELFQLEPEILGSIRASLNLRPVERQRGAGPTGITSAEDQQAYVEALGLLQRARDEKSVDRAIETLQHLLRNARDSPMVNAQLARAFLYKSQLSRRPEFVEQGTVYAERAVELDDTEPEVHVRLGQLRLAAGRHEEAEGEFRRALTLRRDDPDATLGLAVSHEKMGRAADAERAYRKAIELRPDHGATHNLYAVFLFNGGRYEDAAANFRRFTELMPTARGFSNLGEAYRSLGRYEDALRAHSESIALEQTTDGYLGLGHVHYYSGRYAEARQAYQTAVAISPSNYEAWIWLGNVLRLSGAPGETSADAYARGAAAARAAVGVNPRDAPAHAMEAIALAKLGRADEASVASNTALRIDPSDKTTRYAASVVARIRGASNSAIAWIEGAVRSGYPMSDLMRDPEFESMRDDAGFRRAVQPQR